MAIVPALTFYKTQNAVRTLHQRRKPDATVILVGMYGDGRLEVRYRVGLYGKECVSRGRIEQLPGDRVRVKLCGGQLTARILGEQFAGQD